MALDYRWPPLVRVETAVRRTRGKLRLQYGDKGRGARLFSPRVTHLPGYKRPQVDDEALWRHYEKHANETVIHPGELAKVTPADVIAMYKRTVNAELARVREIPASATNRTAGDWWLARMPHGESSATNGHVLLGGGGIFPAPDSGASDAHQALPRADSMVCTWDDAAIGRGTIVADHLHMFPRVRLYMYDGPHRYVAAMSAVYFTLAMLWCAPGGRGVTVHTVAQRRGADTVASPLIFLPPGGTWDEATRDGNGGRFALVMPMRVD